MNRPKRLIITGNIVLPFGMLNEGMLIVENDLIVYVGEKRNVEERVGDQVIHHNGFIWPGLIDIHIHGAGGHDVMDGTDRAVHSIARSLARYGVTGFLPTTVTGPKLALEQAMKSVVKAKQDQNEGAIIHGIHLEGPWICKAYKGAQNESYIVDPQQNDDHWATDHAEGLLKIVTLAPERPGARKLIQDLVKRGVVVSIGHSEATFDIVQKAVSYGASHATHLFNAMRGIHHREPGVVGAAFANDALITELIADGIHVHPAVMKLVIDSKGEDKVVLISDGIAAVGMPNGEYELGGLQVFTENGKATLRDGTLAGSLLTLDEAIRNLANQVNVPMWKAVKMASLTPASRIGIAHQRGSIEVGKKADLVLVSEACFVEKVFIDGVEQERTE